MTQANPIIAELVDELSKSAIEQIIQHCETAARVLAPYARRENKFAPDKVEYWEAFDNFNQAAHYLRCLMNYQTPRD